MVFLALYIYTKTVCDKYAASVEENGGEWGKRLELVVATESLGVLMMCFGIQHALFIGARIGVWIFLQIFCLGCVCIDEDSPEQEPRSQR